MRIGAIAIAALAVLSTRLTAQVAGQVTDSATGRGVDGAEIRIAGTDVTATTNAEGRYTVTGLTPGRHVFVVRKVGYRGARRSATIGNEAVTLDFRLPAAISTLDELVVAGSVIEAKKKESRPRFRPPHETRSSTCSGARCRASSAWTSTARSTAPSRWFGVGPPWTFTT